MENDILYEHHGHVRLITINRAAKMNSLDFAAHELMVEIWREFNADADARVAVLTGTGEAAFCSGSDLQTYTMPFSTTPAPELTRVYTNGPGLGGVTRNEIGSAHV